MAVEIARSLDAIDQKVKALNKTLRAAGEETKELDKALRLDSKDTDASVRKMSALQTAVGTATQKVALLKQKQDEANKAFQRGDISAAEYKKIEVAVTKAENELKGLNNEMAKTQKMRVDQAVAGLDKMTAGLNKAQSAARTLSKVALGIVAALAAAAGAFIKIGDELDDTSRKFMISAEELQKQRNLYAKNAEDAKNFDKALSSLNSVMASIAKGRGAAYIETLEKLGVSTTDASGKAKSAAEVYNEVMLALSAVADETERASLASILFGENGLNVALVAGLTAEEIAAYNAELAQTGIVTSEAAAQAGAIADQIDNCKLQLQAASAELMVALLPVILQLIEIAQVTVIPILTTIANWFASMSPQQLQFVFFLLMLVILLPKLIGMVKGIIAVVKLFTIASKAAAVGVGGVSAASTPLLPIIWAVAAAILVLVLLFAMLAGKSKDVTGELNKQRQSMGAMQDQYSSMAADMGGTVEVTSSNSNTSTQNNNISVDIYGHGDTSISQEAAELVADQLANRINTALGGKI